MIEAGKWYKTVSLNAGTMYYYIYLVKRNDVLAAAFFDDGELFEVEPYDNFVHDGESDFIPPYYNLNLNLNQMGIEFVFEHYSEFLGELV